MLFFANLPMNQQNVTMLNYDAIVSRIRKVIEDNELSAASFAEKIGVQRSGISHILSGRNKPSLDFLSKIQMTFEEVEYDWLLLGKSKSSPSSPVSLFDNPIQSKNESVTKKVNEIQEAQPNSEIKLKEIIYVYSDDSFKLIHQKT